MADSPERPPGEVPVLEVACFKRADCSVSCSRRCFLWIVARNVSLSDLAAAFREADYRLVTPRHPGHLLGYLLRSARWQRIVQTGGPAASSATAFSILMMGFAANNLLPARWASWCAPISSRRKTGVRKTYGMSTIVLERVCDGLTLIVDPRCGLAYSCRFPCGGRRFRRSPAFLFLAAALGILVLLLREGLALQLIGLASRGPCRSDCRERC